MNIIAEVTKDCPRQDCSISMPNSAFVTALAYMPTYDRNGNRTDRGDPNTTTRSLSCTTCGKSWIARTQYGETTVEAA